MSSEDDNPTVFNAVEKRGGKKHSIKATVLDSFTQLSNNSEQTRINGGLKLLGYLFTNDNNEEAEKENSYALNRLLKGIASSRASAKEGYFSVLTTFLANKTDITITSLVKLLNKELQIGGQSKSETGEICTGHVLVCGAVFRSGLFSRSSSEEQELLIATMMNAAGKKTYLGLAAYSYIVDYVHTNSEEDVKEKLWPHLKVVLSKPLVEQNLDSLYCLMVISGKYPELTKKTIKKQLGFKSLLCQDTLTIICDKIMNAPDFASVHHPIYVVFGEELSKSENMVSFWTEGLENKLSLRNQNRVIIALTILNSILKNVTDNARDIPNLLSDKFIPNLLEWFRGYTGGHGGKLKKFRGKQKPNYEEEIDDRQVILKGKEFLDSLVEALKKDNIEKEVTLQVLDKLLFSPGDIMFGEITNSKIIKTLMENLDFAGIKDFADKLKKIVANESKKTSLSQSQRPWTNTERLRAAEMLSHLINHKVAMEHIKWRVKNMQFLLRICLFKTSGDEASASVSTELAAAVKKCFYRCLNFTLPKLETLLKVLASLVEYINENLFNEDSLKKLTKPFSPVTLDTWKSMRQFNKTLVESASQDTSKANTVFQILSLHSGLFLFADVMNEEMARSSIREIQSCYDHYIKDKGSKGNSKTNKTLTEGDIVEDEPEWIEVLVDVFLNFLSRDSFLLRSVVQCVFRLLCEYLTPSAVGQIVSVLDPDSDTNPLSHHGDVSGDEEELSGSDAEDANEDVNGDKEEESDEDDDDESSEDDIDDNTTATDQLRMAVQKALGSAAPETDTESINADDIEEEEGKKLDEALSNAFKMLKQSKGKKSKKDKKNDKILMDFRLRVLDLIDIYLEKEPSMELCLGMLSPLSRCLEFSIKDSEQQPLEIKVRKCLKCLTTVKSFSSTEGVTDELLADYLKAVLNRGSRTQFVFQALGDVVTMCSTFILRCWQKIKPTQTPSKKKKKHKTCPLTEIYKDSLATFFTKRDCLLPVILFHDLLHIPWEGRWELLQVAIDHCFSSGVRQFRKNEGLEMLNMFYKNLKRCLRTETAQEISDKLRSIQESLSNNVLTHFQSNVDVNERFFTILMKLFVTIKTYHTSVKDSQDNMPWSSVTPIVQECRKRLKLKNSQEYFKFCNLFSLNKIHNQQIIITKEKETTDSVHDNETDSNMETTTKDKKHKKGNKLNGSVENGKEKQKPLKRVKKEISKKEAKMLRVQASSEGLQQVSFSQLLESNIDVDDIGEQAMDSDEKKKRKLSDDTIVKKKVKKIKSND